jgi:hypothetical protein
MRRRYGAALAALALTGSVAAATPAAASGHDSNRHCADSGIAVATARFVRPSTNTEAHFAFTMYLVREHGKWTVAADNVHLVSV